MVGKFLPQLADGLEGVGSPAGVLGPGETSLPTSPTVHDHTNWGPLGWRGFLLSSRVSPGTPYPLSCGVFQK